MSLMNIGFLIFIALNFFELSLTVIVNGNKRAAPKHVLTGLTICGMIAFPAALWVAAIPYGLAIFLLLFKKSIIFWYLNLFLPTSHKLNF